MPRTFATAACLVLTLGVPTVRAAPEGMPWVAVSQDKKGFTLYPSGRPFDAGDSMTISSIPSIRH